MPSDRRAQQLFLTPRSIPLLQRIHAMADDAQDAVMAGLNKSERAQLIASLVRVKANLAQMIAPTDAGVAPRSRSKPRR